MREISDFSIDNISEPTCDAFGELHLYYKGKLKLKLKGAILEAQYSCDDKFLIFVTHNIPFEEQLDIHLLSSDFKILESLSVSAAYAAAIFGNATIINDRTVSFTFFDDNQIKLTVRAVKRFRNPLAFGSGPVGRKFGWSTFLDIT